jgi:hypothetical protein
MNVAFRSKGASVNPHGDSVGRLTADYSRPAQINSGVVLDFGSQRRRYILDRPLHGRSEGACERERAGRASRLRGTFGRGGGRQLRNRRFRERSFDGGGGKLEGRRLGRWGACFGGFGARLIGARFALLDEWTLTQNTDRRLLVGFSCGFFRGGLGLDSLNQVHRRGVRLNRGSLRSRWLMGDRRAQPKTSRGVAAVVGGLPLSLSFRDQLRKDGCTNSRSLRRILG